MRTLKITAVLLMLVAGLALLSGCHGVLATGDKVTGDGYQDLDMEFDESRTIELTFWAKNDTNKVQTAVYTKAIQDFEKLYPNVKIKLNLYADYGRIYADVLTNMSTNTLPNICITYPDHIATYMTRDGAVLQLDNWMRDSRYGLGGSQVRFDSPKEAEMVPEFLNECMLNGHYYAMPYMRSTEALYVNVDMLEKLGYELPDVLTWDFVWKVCEEAMAKDGDTFVLNGQDVLIPFIYKSTDNMMITMLKQLNAPYSTENGEVLIFNDVTGSLLKEIYTHAKSRSFSTFAISSYPGNFLNAGQCIFAIDSTAGATWMGGDAPMQDIHGDQLKSFRIAVRPIPQFDPEHPQMISQGPSICIFNQDDPQEVLASWLFTQYLLTNGVQLGYAETEGYLPVTLKAQQSSEYQDYLSRKGEDNNEHYFVKIEASELLMHNTENTFVTPVFNGSANLRYAAGQLIEEACKRGRRNKTLDDQDLQDLYKDINSMFRLNEIEVRKPQKDDAGTGTEQNPDPGADPETPAGEGEKDSDAGKDGTTSGMSVLEVNQDGMPAASTALLIGVPAVWAAIGGVVIRDKVRDTKKKKKAHGKN